MAKRTGFDLPIDLYKKWWDKHRGVKKQKMPFTQEEEVRLVKVHQRFGNNW